MTNYSLHSEWLSLLDVSGPFLAETVLESAFPQGLEQLSSKSRKSVRQAYDEWRDCILDRDPVAPKIHDAWIAHILSNVLELDAEVLKSADSLSPELSHEVTGYSVNLIPHYAIVDDQDDNAPKMLVVTYEAGVPLDGVMNSEGWLASPIERMVELCRGTNVRLGLVTNGEQWMFIDAPIGGVTTFASWYARLWVQEPITLQAFVNLFGVRRFFVSVDQQLPALLDRSLENQDDVTDALGEQVRRAVEVLIQSFDRADIDRSRTLLTGVKATELYEAGLTVMMRIVFLLSAEERGLMLLGDEHYEANYAISTLRSQLRETSTEILDRRWDAWSRLLALFRAVYAGVDHQAMRLPALGGSLFDPDRFPFLEGRAKGSKWKEDQALPLPISNRTVLLLLDAVQLFRGRTLSYRALDVEQIGYVYEGLLERTAIRAKDVTLDLDATKNAKNPWVTLTEIEEAVASNSIADLLKERTKSSASRVKNDLAKTPDASALERLLVSCQNNEELRDTLKPYIHLIRLDNWGYPLVYPKDAFMVAAGMDRRESGTHYTPKLFTEQIVKTTLTPLAYTGPAEGIPKEEWVLKSPKELLDLRICDPAMGSGAFLVQVCRWLSDRLVEAWVSAETTGGKIAVDGSVIDLSDDKELAPNELDERLILAKRLIAEKCLYGVDMNPLAVELAKLSIWLVTLAKGRPFGFLDHNLKSGDSLLGITSLGQLINLDFSEPDKASKKLFAHDVDDAVSKAVELRTELRAKPVNDIHDVEIMKNLDRQAKSEVRISTMIANALIGEVLAAKSAKIDTTKLSIFVGQVLGGEERSISELKRRTKQHLSIGLPDGKPPRVPFHWPLEFPEVFDNKRSGFDAFVGNPPFVGGQRLSGSFGVAYQKYLVNHICYEEKSSVDLVVFFLLRMTKLLSKDGMSGFIVRRSVSEGKNREAGLSQILKNGSVIFDAKTNIRWPGKASVIVHQLSHSKCAWGGNKYLNGTHVDLISEDLSDTNFWEPKTLPQNTGMIFQGTILLGEGFKIDSSLAQKLLKSDQEYEKVIFQFIGGNEVNKSPVYTPICWVICFWDWPEEKAKLLLEAYTIIQDTVKGGRQQLKENGEYKLRKPLPQRWWQYGEKRPALYHSISRGEVFVSHPRGWLGGKVKLDQVMVISTGVTKYPAFTFLPSNYIYSNKLCVLSDDRFSMLAMLSSDIHGVWAWKQKTSLGGDLHSLVYAHGNIFETFPFVDGFIESGNADLEILGQEFFEARQTFMESENLGLTKFYNDFHDPTKLSLPMLRIRDLQATMNQKIADMYKWTGVDLDTGFHDVGYLPDGMNTRFTISEKARLKILGRLSALNKGRYEIENSLNKKAGKNLKQIKKEGGILSEFDLFAKLPPTAKGET